MPYERHTRKEALLPAKSPLPPIGCTRSVKLLSRNFISRDSPPPPKFLLAWQQGSYNPRAYLECTTESGEPIILFRHFVYYLGCEKLGMQIWDVLEILDSPST